MDQDEKLKMKMKMIVEDMTLAVAERIRLERSGSLSPTEPQTQEPQQHWSDIMLNELISESGPPKPFKYVCKGGRR